jgi:hypothetical protein
MYKGSNQEFTPVKRNTADTTAHTAYMYQGTKDALVKN